MPCKFGKIQANYSKYVTLEILQCDQIKEVIMNNKEVDTGPLVVSTSLKYPTWLNPLSNEVLHGYNMTKQKWEFLLVKQVANVLPNWK